MNSGLFSFSPLARDDCMDAGGRATPGAVAEGRVRAKFAVIPAKAGIQGLKGIACGDA